MLEALIIMAKVPEWGKVKTRLAESIGEHGALQAYGKLLTYTLSMAQQAGLAHTVLCYAGDPEPLDAFETSHCQLEEQVEGSLGDRMTAIGAKVWEERQGSLAFIGTDCPYLTPRHLEEAGKALEHFDVVVGPAKDGGYYLLAMKQWHPGLLQGIDWSTTRVKQQTLARVAELGLKAFELETLVDVDHVMDYNEWLQGR